MKTLPIKITFEMQFDPATGNSKTNLHFELPKTPNQKVISDMKRLGIEEVVRVCRAIQKNGVLKDNEN